MITKTMAIAIGVVAILAIGGGAAVLVMNNDKGNTDSGDDLSSFLGLVYGNADGDSKIDSADVALMDKIIAGTESLSDHPLADANRDGTVDDKDKEIANKVINGQETTLFVKDATRIVSVKFPMGNIFTAGGTNMRLMVQVLDIENKIVADATTSYIGPVMDCTLYNLRENGTIKKLNTSAGQDDFKALNTVKGTKGLSTAIIEERSITGYLDDDARSIFADLDIEIMSFSIDSIKGLRQSLATMGILTGSEALAKSYIDVLDNTLDTVKTKIGTKYGTATVMDVTMSNSVSGTQSEYFAMTELAGGKNLADWPDKTRVFDHGDTWLYEEKYNPDYLFHFKSMEYGKTATDTELDSYKSYFKETTAYKNGHYYLLNGVVPVHVRLAWMASIMYADCFEAGWVDMLFQEYMDTYNEINQGKTSSDPGYFSVTDPAYAYYWTV